MDMNERWRREVDKYKRNPWRILTDLIFALWFLYTIPHIEAAWELHKMNRMGHTSIHKLEYLCGNPFAALSPDAQEYCPKVHKYVKACDDPVVHFVFTEDCDD